VSQPSPPRRHTARASEANSSPAARARSPRTFFYQLIISPISHLLMPSNSSFPPLAAERVNIPRHSFTLVKRCRGAKLRAPSPGAAEAAASQQPRRSFRGAEPLEAHPQSCGSPALGESRPPPRLLGDAGPYPKVLPPSIPHHLLCSYYTAPVFFFFLLFFSLFSKLLPTRAGFKLVT